MQNGHQLHPRTKLEHFLSDSSLNRHPVKRAPGPVHWSHWCANKRYCIKSLMKDLNNITHYCLQHDTILVEKKRLHQKYGRTAGCRIEQNIFSCFYMWLLMKCVVSLESTKAALQTCLIIFFNVQWCAKVFAPFLISYCFVFLLQFNV